MGADLRSLPLHQFHLQVTSSKMPPTRPRDSVACKPAASSFPARRANLRRGKEALDFTHTNAYYAWKRVINEEDGSVIPANENGLPLARGYVSDTTTSSGRRLDPSARLRGPSHGWLRLLTPTITAPLSAGRRVSYCRLATPDSSGFSCTGNLPANVAATRVISNQMIEAMDAEIGHLLVKSGLASTNRDGSLNYDPRKTNTMVIIIGDNGTFAPGVKVPFDSDRAKGYVYQTGVWVPLIVSGPLVASPNRESDKHGQHRRSVSALRRARRSRCA